MKKQKRYKEKYEIEMAIDEAKAYAASLAARAEEAESKAKEHSKAADGWFMEATKALTDGKRGYCESNAYQQMAVAASASKEAKKLMKRASSIHENRLPKLKRIYAAFLTEPMAFIDRSLAVSDA